MEQVFPKERNLFDDKKMLRLKFLYENLNLDLFFFVNLLFTFTIFRYKIDNFVNFSLSKSAFFVIFYLVRGIASEKRWIYSQPLLVKFAQKFDIQLTWEELVIKRKEVRG